jgi:hypothetical protein
MTTRFIGGIFALVIALSASLSGLSLAATSRNQQSTTLQTTESTLVIDRLLMGKTPQSGTWLFCFEAVSGESRNIYHVPDNEYEGDPTNIEMGLRLPGVPDGQDVSFRVWLDDDEGDVCSPQAEDENWGSFPATLAGAKAFTAGDNWAYLVYWHIEPLPSAGAADTWIRQQAAKQQAVQQK